MARTWECLSQTTLRMCADEWLLFMKTYFTPLHLLTFAPYSFHHRLRRQLSQEMREARRESLRC